MKRLVCPVCNARLYFENTRCRFCETRVAFVAATSAMVPVESGVPTCAHREAISCNWTTGEDEPFCKACALNRIVPNLSEAGAADRWQRVERAKRRLIVDLMRLGLPIVSRREDPVGGLAFDFMSNALTITPVMTGHADGLITLDIAEADDSEREARRSAMHEPYRTLIGHFRHEIAHYYFDVLIRDGARLTAFRALFGDERADYALALRRHYQAGAPANWREHFITAYASAHPWEDWAETFAHFLHIVATLDTAIESSFVSREALPDDPYREADFDRLIDAFPPLTEAVNEINRSMGVSDVYPFLLTPSVVGKLHFVHMVVREATAPPPSAIAPALAV